MTSSELDRDRYARVFEAFRHCRELAPEDRVGWLAEAFADEPELRAEVEELLAVSDSPAPDVLSDEGIERRDALVPWRGVEAAPGDAGEEALPAMLGPYRIVRRLGDGGMGVVYEAEQDAPRRHVALKLVHPAIGTPALHKRFQLEAAVLARLQHPGIAAIHACGTLEIEGRPRPYLAMEFVDGVDLRAHATRARLDVNARLALVAEVADAVEHANRRGIVHRDLKPDNVLVDGEGRPKVLDFGIARVMDDATLLHTSVTEEGQLLGTLNYMSPEQLGADPAAVGPRADVYALGVILYELVTGRLPHEVAGLALTAAIRIVADSQAPPARQWAPGLSRDVDTIVGKALEKDPARRYPSAGALAADLRRVLEHRPILARPPSAIYRARRFTRRHRGLVAGATLALLALVTGLAGVLAFAGREAEARRQAECDEIDARAISYASIDAELERGERWAARRHLNQVSPERRGWEWRWLDARAPLILPGLTPRFPVLHGRFVACMDLRLDRPWDEQILERSALAVDLAQPERQRRFEGPFVGASLLVAWAGRHAVLSTHLEADPGWTASAHQSGIAILDLEQASVARVLRYDQPSETAGTDFVTVSDWNRGFLVAAKKGGDLDPDWIELSRPLDPDAPAPRRLELQSKNVHLVLVAADGRTLAVVHREDEGVEVLDAAEGRLLGRLEGGKAAFDARGTRMVHLVRDRVRILALPSLEVLREFEAPTDSRDWTVFWVGDDTQIVCGSKDRIFVLDAETGARLEEFVSGHRWGLTRVGSDGRFFVSYGGQTENAWVGELGAPPASAFTELVGHTAWVYPVAFSPSGDLIASSAPFDPEIRLWDGFTGEPVARLARPLARPNTWWNFWAPLVFTADGRRLVTTAPLEPGVATLSWDLCTGETRRGAVRAGHDWTNPSSDLIGDLCAEVGDVAGRTLGPRLVGAPDGQSLIAGDSLGNGLGRNPPVVSRRLTDGATTELGIGRGVGLSPDGRYLAIGDRGHLRIVPAGGGDPIATLFDEGQNTPSYYALAFSPDGERLAVGDSSGRLRIVETTHWRMTIELVQHPDYVYSLAWSPDGERLVSSCGDGIVRLFDALHAIPRRLRAELRAERSEEQATRLAELVDQLGDERRAVQELLDRQTEAPDELRAARRAALQRWARSND